MLSDTEQADAIQTHLPFGTPACPKLLPEREYILCYDPVNRIGPWAGYRLRAEDVILAKRRNAFRTHRPAADRSRDGPLITPARAPAMTGDTSRPETT